MARNDRILARGEAIMRRAEAVTFRPLVREFNSFSQQAARQFVDIGTANNTQALKEHKANLTEILRRAYIVAAEGGLGQVKEEAEGKTAAGFIETKINEFAFDGFLEAWLLQWSQQRAQLIGETSEGLITRAARKATEQALPLTEASKIIQAATGGVVGRSRAMTIAQTESHAALQGAKQALVSSTGIAGRKEWIATNDRRTRAWHLQMDGVTVGAKEKFRVPTPDGARFDLMNHPGDPTAPAAQVINCRCQFAFIPDKVQDLSTVEI